MKTRESGMWHEARRQERRIRGLMVDYRKRAERRREFYERIKQDPTQFLRVYGRPYKIHLESSVAFAAEGRNVLNLAALEVSSNEGRGLKLQNEVVLEVVKV